MSLKVRTVQYELYHVMCDKCGVGGPEAANDEVAVGAAKHNGWSLCATWQGETVDLCEDCAAEVEQEQEAEMAACSMEPDGRP